MPESIAIESLFAFVFLSEPPLWLRGATSGEIVRTEQIPDSDLESVQKIFPDPARREAFLLGLGNTFSNEERSRIGSEGEVLVEKALREQLQQAGADTLASEVTRVSLVSDQLGYDITAPRLDGSSRRVEVKASSRSGLFFSFYLSRNEATVAQRDEDWFLVAAKIQESEQAIVGWCQAAAFVEHLPKDQERGRWESVSVTLPSSIFTAGLPPA